MAVITSQYDYMTTPICIQKATYQSRVTKKAIYAHGNMVS
jgi:hypothetical protein